MDAQGFQMKDQVEARLYVAATKDAAERDCAGHPETNRQVSQKARLRLSGATTEWLLLNRRRFLAAVLREWLQAEVSQHADALQKQYTGVKPSDAARTNRLHMTNPNAVHFGTEGLAAIIEDVWSAERHLQPDFDIAVLYAGETARFHRPQDVLGVMSTSARPVLGGVYIQGLAIHPGLLDDPAGFLKASGLLVEAGIDVSVNLGMRGWVMCHADDVHAVIWRALGFSRQSGPLFQRMGYFDRKPIDRQGE